RLDALACTPTLEVGVSLDDLHATIAGARTSPAIISPGFSRSGPHTEQLFASTLRMDSRHPPHVVDYEARAAKLHHQRHAVQRQHNASHAPTLSDLAWPVSSTGPQPTGHAALTPETKGLPDKDKRQKTLSGSLDSEHADGTDKGCRISPQGKGKGHG
uniref:hypothetical protein n=1 Tax=Mycobacterium sp. TaxID=1785 RepID=UPI003F9A1ED0